MMLRICRYFHSGHLVYYFPNKYFSPIIFFAATVTIRATCLHFMGALLPRSPVFCHPGFVLHRLSASGDIIYLFFMQPQKTTCLNGHVTLGFRTVARPEANRRTQT